MGFKRNDIKSSLTPCVILKKLFLNSITFNFVLSFTVYLHIQDNAFNFQIHCQTSYFYWIYIMYWNIVISIIWFILNVPKQNRSKLGMRSKPGILVAYAQKTIGYRIWLPDTRKIIETISVRFDEPFLPPL